MAKTRTALERVPEGKFDWRPHDKSMSLRDLVTHLSNLPSWTVFTIQKESFDIAPVGEEPMRVEPVTSVADALEKFDANVAQAHEALAGVSDEDLFATWTLLAGGEAMFAMPRLAVIRSMVMSHIIHHRGQLSVYLRLNDVPLPAIYGPTADEAP